MRDEERFANGFGYFLSTTLPITIATLLIPFRNDLTSATVALAFVVGVVVVASVGGRGPGAIAAVVSVLSFDFFHTRPYLSMRISSHDDIETAVLLLVVGLIVGTLSARAHQAQASADDLRSEVRRIHRLAELVASGAPTADVIMTAQKELADLLDLSECRFEAPPYGLLVLPHLERNGAIRGQREHRFVRGAFELPREGVELSVLVSGHPVGRFVLTPNPDVGVSLEQRVVAVALSDQVGAAINERKLPYA